MPSVASQSTLYFCCHFATSGALRASHQRINVGISAIGLSLVTFFGIKKNIVAQACCGHFPLCCTSPKKIHNFSFRSFCQVQRKPSHPTPVFAVYILDAFSKSPSFSLGSASSYVLNSSFFQGLSCTFCTSSHCQCVARSFLFCLTTV